MRSRDKMFVLQQYTTYQAMRRATGTDMEQYFTYLPGLAELVTTPCRFREDMVLEFYVMLWIARNRSEFWFLFREQPQHVTRGDLIASFRFLALDFQLYRSAYPSLEPPRRPQGGKLLSDDLVSIAFPPPHTPGYERGPARLTAEAKVVRAIVTRTIIPRSGYREEFTLLHQWVVVAILRRQHFDLADLLIGEMEESEDAITVTALAGRLSEFIQSTTEDRHSQPASQIATAPPSTATVSTLTPQLAEELVHRGYSQEDVDDLALLQANVVEETFTVPLAGQDNGSESPVDLEFFKQLDTQVAQAQGAQQDPTQQKLGAEPSEDITAPLPSTTSTYMFTFSRFLVLVAKGGEGRHSALYSLIILYAYALVDSGEVRKQGQVRTKSFSFRMKLPDTGVSSDRIVRSLRGFVQRLQREARKLPSLESSSDRTVRSTDRMAKIKEVLDMTVECRLVKGSVEHFMMDNDGTNDEEDMSITIARGCVGGLRTFGSVTIIFERVISNARCDVASRGAASASDGVRDAEFVCGGARPLIPPKLQRTESISKREINPANRIQKMALLSPRAPRLLPVSAGACSVASLCCGRGARCQATAAGGVATTGPPPSELEAIRWGSAKLQGARDEMEDEVVLRPRALLDGFSFAAVFDGHAGFSAVEFLRHAHILCFFLDELYKECVAALDGGAVLRTKNLDAITVAIQRAFAAVDAKLCTWLDQMDKDDDSGATATAMFLSNDVLVVSHIGDSSLITDGRICGDISVSRAFGDIRFKTRKNEFVSCTLCSLMLVKGVKEGRWSEKFVSRIQFKGDLVISSPDVSLVELGPDVEFILLATDGLWDYMKSSEVVDFVRDQLRRHGDVQMACDALGQKVLDERSQDNISIVIADLGRTNWQELPVERPNLFLELSQAVVTVGAVSIGIWISSLLTLQ
ncbi:hypothetical protein PR202_gb05855 [Eleusine coracana subsp. coracana]|uniref:protein-serine/threonine phosphatase n=1 Tax=Eleusine coracana subsp. coracana TaxID=191504 RepID=A0AAV5E829_ELECO|nr:hypothetical protein PR202_gb05855 [Eleusine coracana subsp. coracana]